MPAIVEGQFYRVKRLHMFGGETLYPGDFVQIGSIHEVCEERVYYMRITIHVLESTHGPSTVSWYLSQPMDAGTADDLFEPVAMPPRAK